MDAHKVQGYDRVAYGHLAAAYCVVSRDADVCLATRSAAQTFGLDFIPLHSERYDLVMRKRHRGTARRSRRSWMFCSAPRCAASWRSWPVTIPRDGGRGCLSDRVGTARLSHRPPAVSLAADFDWNLPKGFPRPAVPAGNPMTAAKVELGRYLFYDKRMSVNGKQSCGSCHRQELAFTDGRAHAEGATGQLHPRSSMSLVNVAYVPSLTWANPALDFARRAGPDADARRGADRTRA